MGTNKLFFLVWFRELFINVVTIQCQEALPMFTDSCNNILPFLIWSIQFIHFKKRKISPKFFCTHFFASPWGYGRPRVRVMDIRTQMLDFPRFWGPARSFWPGTSAWMTQDIRRISSLKTFSLGCFKYFLTMFARNSSSMCVCDPISPMIPDFKIVDPIEDNLRVQAKMRVSIRETKLALQFSMFVICDLTVLVHKLINLKWSYVTIDSVSTATRA